MDAVTDDELDIAIKSLPNAKAAGLSGIPYEMLKHLPTAAKLRLRNLITLCLESSFIPSA